MEIASTIIPIFAIIILGWFARKKGFMPLEFLGPANHLVYYIAIPALIFGSVQKASLSVESMGGVLFITLGSVSFAYCSAWGISRLTRWPNERCGAFIQSASHGNLGYIGLPIAFYFLGEAGVMKTSLLTGFVMILQNILSVLFLQAHAPAHYRGDRIKTLIRKLITNPVIGSALAGILVSVCRIPIPKVLKGIIDILSGMAPPMALLLIGGSLSFEILRKNFRPVMGAVAIKLLFLPAVGLFLYHWFRIGIDDFLPGLILLCTPTATVTYVMVREMKGDAEFAVAAISASTMFSFFTFMFWLMAVTTFLKG